MEQGMTTVFGNFRFSLRKTAVTEVQSRDGNSGTFQNGIWWLVTH